MCLVQRECFSVNHMKELLAKHVCIYDKRENTGNVERRNTTNASVKLQNHLSVCEYCSSKTRTEVDLCQIPARKVLLYSLYDNFLLLSNDTRIGWG